MILKLNKLTTDKKKAYKVSEGVLYIDDEAFEIIDDPLVDSWEVTDIEDFESIQRNDEDEIVISLNVFTDRDTVQDFFSIVKKDKIEDAKFPYQIIENETVWENKIEKFEGLEW